MAKKETAQAAPKKKVAAPAPAAEDDFLGMSEPAPTATSTSALDDLNSMFGAQTSAKSFTMSSMVEKKFTATQTKLDAMLAMMDEPLAE